MKREKSYSCKLLLLVVVELHNILAYPVFYGSANILLCEIKMICYVGDRHGFTGRHKSDQIQIYLNKLSAGGGHVIVYKKV